MLVALGLIFLVIVGIIAYLYLGAKEEEGFLEEIKEAEIVVNEVTQEVKEEETSEIMVHVTGHVNKPGVIRLKEGERVIDAINKAGGQTSDADLSKTNLAYVLQDGMKIYVPGIKDEEEQLIGGGDESQPVKVNINTANEDELQKVPGIGASTAAKIVSYRKENGKFTSIEDLKNVSGIGESKFKGIKEYVVVR